MRSVNSKFHYVYLLRCADRALYTGYTIDPERRLGLHNRGIASKFTRSRLPVTIVHLEKFRSKSRALRREVEIKRMKRREKLALCSIAFEIRGKPVLEKKRGSPLPPIDRYV